MTIKIPEQKYWLNTVPETCQACGTKIDGIFYDMKSRYGAWGNFCMDCAFCGPGVGHLGPGAGQEYTRQADGRWLKTRG